VGLWPAALRDDLRAALRGGERKIDRWTARHGIAHADWDTAPLDPTASVGDDNPSMDTKYPMRETILDALKDAAVRPLTPAYQNASTVLSKVLSPPSAIDPQKTAEQLREQLADALQSKGVIP
jgi:hypothetical protein